MKISSKSMLFKKKEIVLIVLFILILVVGILSIQQYTQIQDSSAAIQNVSVSGKLIVNIVDNPLNNKTSTEYLVRKTNGDMVVVTSGQNKLKKLSPFSDVTLKGRARNNGNFTVSAVTKSTSPSTRNMASTSIGNKKVRILLANFEDSPSTHSKDYFRNGILSSGNPTSVNSFMKKSSRNRMALDENNSVVHDWVNLSLPDNLPCDDLGTLYNHIIPTMQDYYTSQGINLQDTSFLSVFYIFKHECPFGARANLGNGSTTPLNIYDSDFTHPFITPLPYSPSHYLSHELGHNLSLHHAQALDCGSSSYSEFSRCEIQTYQHPFSDMGNRGFREFNASEPYRLGWLDRSEYTEVTNGSFQISPLTNTDGSLKVLIVKQKVEDPNRAYFIHLRTSQGAFDNSPAETWSPRPYGVAIELGHIDPTYYDNKYSYLTDTSPESLEDYMDVNDSLLSTNGHRYRDRKNNIEITLNSLSTTSANITISEITTDPRCSQIPDTGPCRAMFTKYFFNQNSSKCESFTWGGCQGVVPFQSLQDCKNSCI